MDIVILHGWGSSAGKWQEVKHILEEEGYKVFVPNLPGFGGEKPPDYPWSVEDYAEWLNQWAERQNLSYFCLIGHSFGGGVAVVFTAKYPQKVAKLVLVSAAIIRKRSLKYYLVFLVTKIGSIIFLLPPFPLFRAKTQKLFYQLLGLKDYYLLKQKTSNSVMREIFKKVIKKDLKPYLRYISCPTLILWGDKDKLTPLAQAKIIKAHIPNSELKILSGRGHALNLEAPQELTGNIISFLKEN